MRRRISSETLTIYIKVSENNTETETETLHFITIKRTIPPTTANAAGFSSSLSRASDAVSADSTATIVVPITGNAAKATKAPDDAPPAAPAPAFAPAFSAPSAAAPAVAFPAPLNHPILSVISSEYFFIYT